MLNSHVQRSYRNKRSACERPLCVRNFHCFRQRMILLLTALLHVWHRTPFLEVLTRLNLLVSKVVEFCQYNKVKLFEMYSLCLSPPCDESRGIMLVYLVVWDVYCKEIMTSSTARAVMLNNCPNKVGKCRYKGLRFFISLILSLSGEGLDRAWRWCVGLGLTDWTNWTSIFSTGAGD